MDQQPFASQASPNRESAQDSSAPTVRRRHRWVWVVVLVLFGFLFYWAYQHNKAQAAATGGGGRRGMMTGPVPVTLATAQSGSLGVYLDAIGTVTPVYTDAITTQVTGVITAVHYREGQFVHKGDPLIDIDPRPYEAKLAQAQGTLERDQNLLAQAQMDLDRYQDAWARTPSRARRSKTRRRSSCRIRARSRTIRAPCSSTRCRWAIATSLAHHRPRRPSPGRSRQPGHGDSYHHARGGHADTADHRGLHHRRRQLARCAQADAQEQLRSSGRLRPHPAELAGAGKLRPSTTRSTPPPGP